MNRSIGLKIQAFTVLGVFLWTSLAYPAPGVQSVELLQGGLRSYPDSRMLGENPFGIRLDEKDGSVAGFFSGRGDRPLVIHIQDAHGQIAAQKNIQKILSKIAGSEESPYHLCLVEGAKGYVNRAPLKAFLNTGYDPRPLLLSKAMINGPELASLNRSDMILWGIEDEDLYRRNREAFLKARKTRDENLLFIAGP
jgi:hypothetical protein